MRARKWGKKSGRLRAPRAAPFSFRAVNDARKRGAKRGVMCFYILKRSLARRVRGAHDDTATTGGACGAARDTSHTPCPDHRLGGARLRAAARVAAARAGGHRRRRRVVRRLSRKPNRHRRRAVPRPLHRALAFRRVQKRRLRRDEGKPERHTLAGHRPRTPPHPVRRVHPKPAAPLHPAGRRICAGRSTRAYRRRGRGGTRRRHQPLAPPKKPAVRRGSAQRRVRRRVLPVRHRGGHDRHLQRRQSRRDLCHRLHGRPHRRCRHRRALPHHHPQHAPPGHRVGHHPHALRDTAAVFHLPHLRAHRRKRHLGRRGLRIVRHLLSAEAAPGRRAQDRARDARAPGVEQPVGGALVCAQRHRLPLPRHHPRADHRPFDCGKLAHGLFLARRGGAARHTRGRGRALHLAAGHRLHRRTARRPPRGTCADAARIARYHAVWPERRRHLVHCAHHPGDLRERRPLPRARPFALHRLGGHRPHLAVGQLRRAGTCAGRGERRRRRGGLRGADTHVAAGHTHAKRRGRRSRPQGSAPGGPRLPAPHRRHAPQARTQLAAARHASRGPRRPARAHTRHTRPRRRGHAHRRRLPEAHRAHAQAHQKPPHARQRAKPAARLLDEPVQACAARDRRPPAQAQDGAGVQGRGGARRRAVLKDGGRKR